jgi:hypothetical protein
MVFSNFTSLFFLFFNNIILLLILYIFYLFIIFNLSFILIIFLCFIIWKKHLHSWTLRNSKPILRYCKTGTSSLQSTSWLRTNTPSLRVVSSRNRLLKRILILLYLIAIWFFRNYIRSAHLNIAWIIFILFILFISSTRSSKI